MDYSCPLLVSTYKTYFKSIFYHISTYFKNLPKFTDLALGQTLVGKENFNIMTPLHATSICNYYHNHLICYKYEVIDTNSTYCDNHFTVYVCQVIMVDALKLYSAIFQLYINKTQ